MKDSEYQQAQRRNSSMDNQTEGGTTGAVDLYGYHFGGKLYDYFTQDGTHGYTAQLEKKIGQEIANQVNLTTFFNIQ